MYSTIRSVNAATQYEVTLAGTQFFNNANAVCGGGALITAVNLPSGSQTNTKVPFSCDDNYHVTTYNYKYLATGKTGTVQGPKYPTKPGISVLVQTWHDPKIDKRFDEADALVAPVLEITEEAIALS